MGLGGAGDWRVGVDTRPWQLMVQVGRARLLRFHTVPAGHGLTWPGLPAATRRPSPPAQALQFEPTSHIVAGGGLATMSGAKTGRSPRDKRIVREAASEGDIWWGAGSHNYEMDER